MKTRLFFVLACAVALLLVVALAAAAKESPPGGELVVSGANAAPAEAEDLAASAAATAPWFRETVDSPNNVGQHVSVAIDPVTGTTYISYYDATEKELRMAKHVGSGGNCGLDNSWNCETVDDSGEVGQYSSIAINPSNGLPGIAYYDATNYALKLAIRYVFDWTITTIDDPLFGITGLYTSLKFDSTGKARIAYYSSNFPAGSLRYAKYVGGGAGNNCTDNDYQCDTIDSGDHVGRYASLSLDGSDRPRIAYYDGGNDNLKFAAYGVWHIAANCGPGNSWTCWMVDGPGDVGQFASLSMNPATGGQPHIAYYDATNEELKYATYQGSGNCGLNPQSFKFEWQCDEIESVGTGTHPMGVSLAVDGAGYPLIAYQNATEGPLGMGTLKVARPVAALNQLVGNCGPVSLFYTWQCDTLLPLGPNYYIYYRPADYVGIDLNSAGLATIAYYGYYTNTGGGDLQVTYQMLQTFLPLIVKD